MGLFLFVASAVRAHDVTTKVTWNREISRIVYARCASCHQPGGTAFSLLTYADASPWGKAIRASVLERTMPPWGAVKGFGNFRDDQALMQDEITLIENWVNGGMPEGNPNDLPSRINIAFPAPVPPRSKTLQVQDTHRFERPLILEGFIPSHFDPQQSVQITLAFPSGEIVPLVWLKGYGDRVAHPFYLRKPLSIPTGAVLHGVASGSLTLILSSSR